MGVLIDTNRRAAIKIDVDTIMIQDAIDSALAEYLHIITELGAGTVVYASKIGDHQFKDIDDIDNSDIFQITADDLGGGVKQSTTKPAGSIWEIEPTTVDYIAANTLNYLDVDLQNVTVTDGGNAVILRGLFLDMDALTETDIGDSSLYGARIEMSDMSEWSAGAGIQVLENTDDYVVEIINKDNNALSIYGVSQDAAGAFEGRNWALIKPSVETIDVDTNTIFLTIDTDNWIIDDGATTPEITGIWLNLDDMTETNVDGTVLYGQIIDMPDVSVYATAVGLRLTEHTDDYVIEMINNTNNALSIYGVSQDAAGAFEGRSWVLIKPSVETIDTEAHSILFSIDTDNWTIDDGANTPEITAILLNLDDMTETEHDGTVLLGMDIEMPDDMVGYATAYGIRVANATQSVYILNDGVDALNWVGDASGDTLDLTPASDVDALDIIGTNMTTASAIDIDLAAKVSGDVINIGMITATLDAPTTIIDISNACAHDGAAADALIGMSLLWSGAIPQTTADANLTMLKLDIDTIFGSGAGGDAGILIGLDADFSGATINGDSMDCYGIYANMNCTDTDFITLYGLNILMPAAYQGTDPTSAIHATGNDMTIDILHEGDFGIELETDVQDLDNALLPIFITKDLNITVTHADGGTLTNSGNTVDVTIDTYSLDTTPATNPNNTSAVGLHVYQRHRQGNANDVGNIDELFTGATIDLDQILTINNTNGTTPSIVTTAPFIDMDLDVTETAGVIEIGAVDWISLSVDGGSIASAVAVKMLNFESAITLNNAAAEFYGFVLNTTGMTDTLSQADSVGGLSIVDDGILDYGIKLVNAVDTLKIMDTENDRGIYIDLETATSTGLYIDADKGVTANDLIALETTRDMIGALTATSFTNYANIMGQSMIHSSNDAIATNDEGVLQLVLNHDIDYASTNPDVFSATALNITVTCDMDDVGADLDTSARALDIDYTVARSSAGAHRLAATDIARIAYTAPAGMTSAAGFEFNLLKLDTGTSVIDDANISFRGIDIELVDTVDTDFAVFYGINIDMPAVYQGVDPTSAIHCTGDGNVWDALSGDYGLQLDMNEAASTGLYILSDTIGTIANAMKTIDTSRDFAGVSTADIAMTNYSINHSVINVNTPTTDFDFDFDTGAGVMSLVMQQTNTSSFDKTNPDKFNATCLNIEIDAITVTEANSELDAAPRAIDISFAITETAGTLQLGTTDAARIQFEDLVFSTAGAMTLTGLFIDIPNAETFNDANITFMPINIDCSNITNTSSAWLGGIDITMGASADAALRVTMGATPAVAGIQVVSNAAAEIAFTTNGEIVAGNYPEEAYLPFEMWETSDEANVNISQVYYAAQREICLNVDFTGDGSVTIWCQFIIPDDFKEFPDTSDDITVEAIQDGDSGDGVGDIELDMYFYDHAGTESSTEIEGVDLTATWDTFDIPTVSASGTWAVGDRVMVKMILESDGGDLIEAGDGCLISIPKVKYKRSG